MSFFRTGYLTMIIPPYQSEICAPSIRGRVTSLQQFMLGIGSLMAAWISYGTYIGFPDSDSAQWRLALGIQIIPAVVLAALILLFPESPRWLIDHGRVEEGLQTLAKLHARGDVNDPWVRAEFDQIQESITFEHEHGASSLGELFRDRSCFRRLLIACSVQAAIQMTGVSAIQYYSVEIYAKIGIAGNETLKYQAISNVLALVAEFLCMLFIDKLGRRWVLITGNVGNAICFLVATVLLAKFPPSSNGDDSHAGAAWGFIAMTWLYNFVFSLTCGPLSWIIPAELFDTKTRAYGVAIACMVSYGFNTMIGQTTSVALDAKNGIGWRWYILFIVSEPNISTRGAVTFLFYLSCAFARASEILTWMMQVCNLSNALWFWAVLPETKNRPLEEMRYLFTEAPMFVPSIDMAQFKAGQDLERRVEEVEHKQVGAGESRHEERRLSYE
jgi:sugar porter (SP) family MFS transporter